MGSMPGCFCAFGRTGGETSDKNSDGKIFLHQNSESKSRSEGAVLLTSELTLTNRFLPRKYFVKNFTNILSSGMRSQLPLQSRITRNFESSIPV